MPLFQFVQLPADGAGKRLASRLITGGGEGPVDVYAEADVVIPENGVGYQVFSQELIKLTNAFTKPVDVDIALQTLVLCNYSGAPVEVEVTDDQGTPIHILKTVLPVGWAGAIDYGGVKLVGGIRWKAASTDAVSGALKGYVA